MAVLAYNAQAFMNDKRDLVNKLEQLTKAQIAVVEAEARITKEQCDIALLNAEIEHITQDIKDIEENMQKFVNPTRPCRVLLG